MTESKPRNGNPAKNAQRPPLHRSLNGYAWAGLLVLLLDGCLLLFTFLAVRPQFTAMGSATLMLFVVGKDASIPLGIALGGNPWLVGSSLFMLDSGLILLLYPAVLSSMEQARQRPGFVGSFLRRAHRLAERRPVWIRRYGVWGLYLYLIIPFAYNFPLVGAVLGHILGIPAGRVMVAIQAALMTTTVAWTALSVVGFSALPQSGPAWPIVASLGVTAVVLGLGFVDAMKNRRVRS